MVGQRASTWGDLKWDYTTTQHAYESLVETRDHLVQELLVTTETPTIVAIHQGITLHREETRCDSRRARAATRKLYWRICKIAKTRSKISEMLSTVNTQEAVLESDLASIKGQSVAHEAQLTDTKWKLEEFENRQSRNNLMILRTEKGAEGSIVRAQLELNVLIRPITVNDITEVERETEIIGKISGYHLNKGETEIECTKEIHMIDERRVDSAMYLEILITAKVENMMETAKVENMMETAKVENMMETAKVENMMELNSGKTLTSQEGTNED
ncbi:hypothetical protein NDU88_005922 [Pleurodeles waltl]|uniref:Uncharacterized protein n=1 Tax=Pleurodeles waltl TaxID=8319 RepID=A0AAV7MXT7_PLEWA|nr:hypothetical protein NDU88_005922 [Pleurodeles waltl]